MIPVPNYVYECPNCGNFLTKGRLMSRSILGARIFSDCKRTAPMLPNFPILTKGKKCTTIFWLSKLKEIGAYEWAGNKNPAMKSLPLANTQLLCLI